MTKAGVAPVVPITVVISTLDRPEQLARCLDALLAGTRLPEEIVIVDQGDASSTVAILESRRLSGVQLVHVPQRVRGLSASQNTGVRHARCAAVAVVDDDCVPDPRWVEVASALHCGAGHPLLVGGRVLPLPPVGDRTVPLASRPSTTRVVLPHDAFPWDVGTGGNFSVTRASYLAVGGNDERLGTGTPGRAGNDLDLFHRLLRTGVEARFEPDLLVLHERATPAENRSRSWTYGFGVGVCVVSWLAEGDRAGAQRVTRGWLRMRAWLLWTALRRPRSILDEVRVLLGTAHGVWYGWRLGPRPPQPGSCERPVQSTRQDGHVNLARVLRLATHPVATGSRLVDRLATGPGLPLGQAAPMRRLLRKALGDRERLLVIGHPGVVRQALPHAVLDVVGTSPSRTEVSVVSEALGAGSLPQRWRCVIVTEPEPSEERLAAATNACLPGGVVAAFTSSSIEPTPIPGTDVVHVLGARKVRLVIGRVVA